ncbi:MAG: ABC transporter permease, partial [Mycoplasma sp.]|nr:ABC transporter permease [Mycoplasma sp.]
LKMLKSVGGGIYIFLLTFIAFIIPGSFLIFKVSDLSNISKLWMKVNKYLLIVGITFIFTSLKVMQIFRNDIKDGTLLILLSKPISRTRIYLQKFFAIFTMIIIVSIFYLLFTNLPLYLIIKNIDPSQPFTRLRDAIDDYTSINLPLINNLISDVKANIVYGFLNLIIVLIVSSLFIMLTMVFQNIKLTIFAPLIGMGVVIFNTESVIMKLMLKDDDYRSNSIKYMDINYGSPLLLLNDLKSSTNKDKKLIWEDIKEIFRQKIEVRRKYKDLFDNNNNHKGNDFDIKKDKPNGEERLTILEDVIFKNLKVWKLDFKNLNLNRELNELLTTRLKEILPIKQKIDLLDSAIKGIKDKQEGKRKKLNQLVSEHWDEL